jgi:hypothetical protein
MNDFNYNSKIDSNFSSAPLQTPSVEKTQKKRVLEPVLENVSSVITVESKGNHPSLVNRIGITNQDDLTHLEQQMEVAEKTLKQDFEDLKRSKKNTKLVESVSQVKKWGVDRAKDINSTVSSAAEYLKKVFPSKILDNIPEASTWLGSLINCGDHAFIGAALICKRTILNEAKKKLAEIKEKSSLSSEEIKEWEVQLEFMEEELNQSALKNEAKKKLAEIKEKSSLSPEEIKEWEVQLEFMEEELNQSALKFGFKTAKFTCSSIKQVSSWLQFKSNAIPVIGQIGSLLGLCLAAFSLKESIETFQTQKDWIRDLKTVSFTKQQIKKLHHQRLERFEKKIQKEEARFEELKPQLKELETPVFDRLIQSIQDTSVSHLGIKEVQKRLEEEGNQLNPLLFQGSDIQKICKRLEEQNISVTPSDFHELGIAAMQNKLKNSGLQVDPQLFNETDATQFALALDRYLTEHKEEVRKSWLETPACKEALLKAHVDHQETIAISSKSALKSIIQKKHEQEVSFLKLQLTESSIFFALAAITAVISAVSFILLLAGVASGPIGPILIALSVISTVAGLGLSAAGLFMLYKKKPSIFKASFDGTFTFLKINKMMFYIRDYQQNARKIKMQKLSHIIHDVKTSPTKRMQAKKDYSQVQKEFESYSQKADYWHKKLKTIFNQLSEGGWIDFTKQNRLSYTPEKIQEEFEKKRFELQKTGNRLETFFGDTNKANQNSEEFRKLLDQYAIQKKELQHFQNKHKIKFNSKYVSSAALKEMPSLLVDIHDKKERLKQQQVFDTLKAISEALSSCDPSLLDEDTDRFLRVHLGINLNRMKAKGEQDKTLIQQSLKKLFTLSQDDIIEFINLQQKRMEKGIL